MICLLSALVVLLKICGGELKTYPVRLEQVQFPVQVLQKDLNSVDEIYGSYFTISDDKMATGKDGKIPKMYLNKLTTDPFKEISANFQLNNRQETLLLVKTLRHRDKRQITYLTLCHFKICNMGRKRSTRYFHMIKTLNGNDAPPPPPHPHPSALRRQTNH